jgi:hypothetical protein
MRSFFGAKEGDAGTANNSRYMPVGGGRPTSQTAMATRTTFNVFLINYPGLTRYSIE